MSVKGVFELIRYKFGKRTCPIVRLEEDGKIIDVRTSVIEEDNCLIDPMLKQAWEKNNPHPRLIMIDGQSIGRGYVVTWEGITPDLDVPKGNPGGLLDIVTRITLRNKDGQVVTARYEGLFGQLIDIDIIKRGSNLAVSRTAWLVGMLVAFLLGGVFLGRYF